MAKSSEHLKSSSALPSYQDRLPKLLDLILETARRMRNLPEVASYLPNWEPLYESVHSLKGLVKIIECSEFEKDSIIALSDSCGKIAVGNLAVRNGPIIAKDLLLIHDQLKNNLNIELALNELCKHCNVEWEHSERMQQIRAPRNDLSDFSSKRAYELEKFKFRSKTYAETIDLTDFPNWHKKLSNAVRGDDKDRRGLLVACTPNFIAATNNRNQIEAWAWVAPGRPDDSSVFQRVEIALPNAKSDEFR